MNNEIKKTPDNTIELEKMRYNNNSLSYKLGLGGILFSLLACFIGLNSVHPSNSLVMVVILINIAVFLFGFLSSEKVKIYSKKYSFYMYGLGGICFLRIFIYPAILLKYYAKFKSMIKGLTGNELKAQFDEAQSLYKDKLGATVIGKCIKDGDTYKLTNTGYLFGNGTARAIVIIVFLLLACACFVSSGIINQIKQKKLSNYLASLDNEKSGR